MYYQTRPLRGPETRRSRVTDLYQTDPGQYPYILASTAAGHNSRFDILFAHPQKTLTLYSHALAGDEQGFLASLHDWWLQQRIETGADDSPLPFTGGWFIYLSYELAAEIEPVLKLPTGSQDDPVAMAVRCPAAVIYDHQHQQHIVVAENEYAHLLDTIEQDFNNVVTDGDTAAATAAIKVHAIKEADERPYLDQVTRIKQYIVDGDIFQANLSRPWSLELDHQVSDTAIFNSLATANPGSFAVLARLPASTVISSSPERLVSVHQGAIETRPIAGTRPRSDDEMLDEQLATELMAHPKEQAEHIMLIDLERNDLGRICVPGSIKVNELMTLESYQHVHHIVSNVIGRLRDDVSPADVIRAVFPGGTITGCPKVRCMEILAEMEQQSRGAYTGSIGYINRNGDMDLNILIRTLVRKGNSISFRAGGGIVADSDAQHELAETRAKAKGLLRALGIE
ncbi:MAG: aminodeoxychorismate synthase component I [Gammaproteobacteria bacterium]|nr:aminodeoxychorismate synthase component I [Gammaproteobacteria bacterium]